MNRLTTFGIMAAMVCASGTAWADFFPSAELIVIDRGVPTDGTIEMTGYRGYTVRVVAEEPIVRVRAGEGYLGNGGAVGGMAHRWEDPTGTGTFSVWPGTPTPTIISPGLLPYDNTTPSEWNFDSHWLLDPDASYNLLDAREYGYFDQSINPIPSTPFVGYGTAYIPMPVTDPMAIIGGGNWMVADYLITTPDVYELDLAYIVTNSAVIVNAAVSFSSGHGFGVDTLIGEIVPEPASPAALLLVSMFASRRSRRQGRKSE